MQFICRTNCVLGDQWKREFGTFHLSEVISIELIFPLFCSSSNVFVKAKRWIVQAQFDVD